MDESCAASRQAGQARIAKYFITRRDPNFTHSEASAAEPLSFQNDYMGLFQEVYRYDDTGKKTHVKTRLKAELKSFARTWFQNLKDQGFLGDTAIRERLT